MKCYKCEKEVDKNSKFCSFCGKKVEEKSLSDCLHEATESTRRLWFIIGFLKGTCSSNKKEKEFFENHFEKAMRGCVPKVYEEYQDAIRFWKEYAECDVNNYAIQKKNARLKQTGIRETKTVQKK